MRDFEVDQVLDAIDGSFAGRPVFGTRSDPTPTRALWGAELSRLPFEPAMRVVASLLRTERWRPPLADIIARVASMEARRIRAIEAPQQAALPAAAYVSPERVDELVAPLLRLVKPPVPERNDTIEESLELAEAAREKVLGALALQVLRERRANGNTVAAEVLAEADRRMKA